MGNTLSASNGFVAWELMNEDTMLVVLKYITVFDYVQLSLACRKFLYFLLGPNNYFWAQLCNNLLKDDEEPNNEVNYGFVQSARTGLRIRPKNANELLKYVQNGRKFRVDGKLVDLNRRINTIDKHFVSHFNFKEEIKAYFFEAVLRVNLELHIRRMIGDSDLLMVRVDLERQPDLKNLWTKLTNISHHYNLDYSFIVDIGTDPMESASNFVDLPFVYKNRLVWYVRGAKHHNRPFMELDPLNDAPTVYSTEYRKIPNLVRHPEVFQLPNLEPNDEQELTTAMSSLSLALGYNIPPNFK